MNRRKKIKQLLEAHAKKANAKLAPKKKSTYISKADRLKLAEEANQDSIVTPEPTESDLTAATKDAPQP
jgi:transcription initiation factor TFIIIB Brf1 subunit/transcription initiation factor TFIIB